MSVYELAKQPRTHALPPARASLSQRKCACGGTPGPDGECAACKAKRLARQRATNPALVAGGNHDQIGKIDARPGHDFGKMSVRPPTTMASNENMSDHRVDLLPSANIRTPARGGGSKAAGAPSPGFDEPLLLGDTCKPAARFTTVPSGVLKPVMGKRLFGVPFTVKAEFVPPYRHCKTGRGEYRQFARGFSFLNGDIQSKQMCSKTFSITEFHEDCVSGPFGEEIKAGYHSIPTDFSRFSNPDQATGDTYELHDEPGLPVEGLKSGDVVIVHFEFLGLLVDPHEIGGVGNKPEQLSPLASASWTVEGAGVVP